MRRFKITITILICFGFWIANLYAESQKPTKSNSMKQQEEAVPGQTQAEEHFNPAECFDKVWQIINEEFWNPNCNGVDWEDAGKRYRPKALASKDHESFAVIDNQMLAELKTSHTRYFTRWEPDYYTLQAALISGDLRENNTTDTKLIEKTYTKRGRIYEWSLRRN